MAKELGHNYVLDFPMFGKAEMKLETYSSGKRLAIQFYMIEGDCPGEPLATLTVNFPDRFLGEEEFFVKVWSENEYIIPTIRESGWFVDTGNRVSSGFVTAEIWKFSPEHEHLYKNWAAMEKMRK